MTTMKMKVEYAWQNDKIINVVVFKQSITPKLGNDLLIATYHFSIDQFSNFRNDKENCLDCPYSYNSGNGKCYTHKGPLRLGLSSMIRRLSKMNISEFNNDKWNEFLNSAVNAKFVRFGVYGEPIFLTINQIKDLTRNRKWSGYTHQWFTKNEYKNYLMASVHDSDEGTIAENMGWRFFMAGKEESKRSVNCPASKEAGRKSNCQTCALCNGFNSKKHIWITQH